MLVTKFCLMVMVSVVKMSSLVFHINKARKCDALFKAPSAVELQVQSQVSLPSASLKRTGRLLGSTKPSRFFTHVSGRSCSINREDVPKHPTL